MRTEMNVLIACLFVCSFICSVAFMNKENESGFKANGYFEVYTETDPNSPATSDDSSSSAYNETVAPPSSGTSSMHGKNGEFEVYYEHVNIKTINLQQKPSTFPTQLLNANERILFYKMNEKMSVDVVNRVGYYSTFLALERHFLAQQP